LGDLWALEGTWHPAETNLRWLEFSDSPETILEDKVLLKKIYSALKKQQLHRTLHSKEPNKKSVNRSTSLSCLKIGAHESVSSGISHKDQKKINENFLCVKKCDTSKISKIAKNSNNLDLNSVIQSFEFPNKCLLNDQKIDRSLKSCGTQTSFIQLSELKSLAEQYKCMVQNSDNSLQVLQGCKYSIFGTFRIKLHSEFYNFGLVGEFF